MHRSFPFAALRVRMTVVIFRLNRRFPGDFAGQWKKGAGVIRTLFFYYFHYINSWGGNPPKRPTLFSYPIMDLAGKPEKWGLDKICDGGCAVGCTLRAHFVKNGLMFQEEAWGLGEFSEVLRGEFFDLGVTMYVVVRP